jgi:anti-anti-sigma factor
MHRDAGKATVALDGELDLMSVALPLDCFAALDHDIGNVVLDFTGLDFIDCSGLRVIADMARELAACGGSLKVLSIQSHIRRVLDRAIEVSGAHQMLRACAGSVSAISPRARTPRLFDRIGFEQRLAIPI